MSAPFRLTLWTADAALAARADAAGVDRIGVDLDRLGKAERQAGWTAGSRRIQRPTSCVSARDCAARSASCASTR